MPCHRNVCYSHFVQEKSTLTARNSEPEQKQIMKIQHTLQSTTNTKVSRAALSVLSLRVPDILFENSLPLSRSQESVRNLIEFALSCIVFPWYNSQRMPMKSDFDMKYGLRTTVNRLSNFLLTL